MQTLVDSNFDSSKETYHIRDLIGKGKLANMQSQFGVLSCRNRTSNLGKCESSQLTSGFLIMGYLKKIN